MDGLCFKPGGISSSLPFNGSGGVVARTLPAQVSALGRGSSVSATASAISVESSAAAAATAPSPSASSPSSGRYSSAAPPRLLEKRNDEIAPGEELEREEIEPPPQSEMQRGNWVSKILHIGSIWSENRRKPDGDAAAETVDSYQSRCFTCDDEGSDGCSVDDRDGVEFDRESFSRLLRRVSLVEVKVYARMSYLGSLAYAVGKIKPGNLLKYQGLRFVTSSLVKKAQTLNAEKEQVEEQSKTMTPEKQALAQTPDMLRKEEDAEGEKQRNNGYWISASAAYQIAATAASDLQSHTSSFLPSRSAKTETVVEDSLQVGSGDNEKDEITSPEVASLMATTNSMTAVVAGDEEMKQAVAKDLSSARSSPCEWFICDDERCGTRFFVIQGSESIASWQTNLLFEPVQFEGLDVLVHRGIYEAAKGIYEQMLPEVRAHLKSHGNSATLRFTGHSLGGSLALLVNLMLLIRGEAPLSSLLPVITFGAPSIMCGGDYLLRKLGLPQKHVQAIMMHRDIVPRAFSCSYPDRVAELLRAVNGNFRNHPCLKNQKLLYAPMGEVLILQPDEKFSPHHDLLPPGSGLYLLGHPISNSDDWARQLQAAQAVFLNSPHPLEILSDPAAYGSDGAIYRDHDMNSYLRSVRDVVRQELKHIRKAKREQRRKAWWPLVTAQGLHPSIVEGHGTESANMGQHQLNFSGVFRSGRESLKRVSRLVASQHMHMLVVLLLPAKSLLLETFSVTGFN